MVPPLSIARRIGLSVGLGIGLDVHLMYISAKYDLSAAGRVVKSAVSVVKSAVPVRCVNKRGRFGPSGARSTGSLAVRYTW